jgi:hypothetical protein
MSDLTSLKSETPQIIHDAMQAVADTSLPLEDRAAIYGVLHQIQLRINRAIKAARDDLIVGIERAGVKELGPLSIKSTAVDPVYECNQPDNWTDEGVQSAMADLWADAGTNRYIRSVPAHLEIDVHALAEDVQLGVKGARDLYRQLNEKRWRVEQARRLSLAVREVKGKAA